MLANVFSKFTSWVLRMIKQYLRTRVIRKFIIIKYDYKYHQRKLNVSSIVLHTLGSFNMMLLHFEKNIDFISKLLEIVSKINQSNSLASTVDKTYTVFFSFGLFLT